MQIQLTGLHRKVKILSVKTHSFYLYIFRIKHNNIKTKLFTLDQARKTVDVTFK